MELRELKTDKNRQQERWRQKESREGADSERERRGAESRKGGMDGDGVG